MPSKENGLDVEGLAAADGDLYVGFRGPVITGDFVPVLKLAFDGSKKPQLLFVTLGGSGIRSLEHAADGAFLIISGPVNDAPGEFRLHQWNGRDCIPGEQDDGSPPGRVTFLGTIPTPPAAKAEGLAVLGATDDHYELLILFDGPERGAPQRFRVAKP